VPLYVPVQAALQVVKAVGLHEGGGVVDEVVREAGFAVVEPAAQVPFAGIYVPQEQSLARLDVVVAVVPAHFEEKVLVGRVLEAGRDLVVRVGVDVVFLVGVGRRRRRHLVQPRLAVNDSEHRAGSRGRHGRRHDPSQRHFRGDRERRRVVLRAVVAPRVGHEVVAPNTLTARPVVHVRQPNVVAQLVRNHTDMTDRQRLCRRTPVRRRRPRLGSRARPTPLARRNVVVVHPHAVHAKVLVVKRPLVRPHAVRVKRPETVRPAPLCRHAAVNKRNGVNVPAGREMHKGAHVK
jgi:hypothetical protein